MRFIKMAVPVICVCGILIATMAAGREVTDIEFNAPDTSVIEINTNRHTQAEMNETKVDYIVDLEEFEPKIENDTLEIWFHEDLASIRVVDKRSGYIWGFVGVEKPENLNKSWFAMANSLCTIEYYDKKEAEKKISLSSGDMDKEYIWTEDALECRVKSTELGIEFSFTMTLKKDCLTFSVIEGSLVEGGESKIKSIYFAPFLGTTQEDQINGYMLVPDGPGALIRYGKALNYNAGFSKKIYGNDMGIDSLEAPSGMMSSRSDDFLVEEPQIFMPIYGIVHGSKQNGILAVIENSEEYATIMANVSGIITNYNWVAARFDYRQSYMHPTTKAGSGVYKPQENSNNIRPEISFYFLTGENADYSGMAVYYRNLLDERGVFETERIDDNIPLRLDVLGSDVKKGFLYNPLKTFTTTKEAEQLLTELDHLGISNVTMTYIGWQDGGINGARYGELDYEKNVGNKENFHTLKEKVEASNGRLYLYLDPITANEKQIYKAGQSVVNMSKAYAQIKRADNQLMFPETYFIKPSVVLDMLKDSEVAGEPLSYAYDSIGYRLYADYTRNKTVTRQETQSLFTDQLKGIGNDLALYQPNQYLWQYTAEYFDIPMVNSQYLYETDTIPFMQILLKGNVDYYAPYANQGLYSVNSILKMIEYGTYPSFIVASAKNQELTDTPQVELFTVNFYDWKDTILDIYTQINRVLSKVEGSRIMEHKVIMPGVVSVLYDNGITIYINYNTVEYSVDNVTIPGQGVAVRERKGQ